MKTLTVKIKLERDVYALLREHYSDKELKAAVLDDVYAEIYDLVRALQKVKKESVKAETTKKKVA